MTPAEWAEQTAQAQGLPAQVTDPAALRRVAILLAATREPDRKRRARRGRADHAA